MAEQPPKETSIEKTSAVVESATRIERTSIQAETKTGRTVWDAIVDLAKFMGPYAPWAIMIAGLIFAFFKFTQLQETEQGKARERVQNELDSAHKELRDTYNQIADMNKQELANVKSMLEVHEQSVKSTEDQRKKYNELRDQSSEARDELEKARQRAEQEKVDANKAKKDASDALKSASEAATKVDRSQKDLTAKEAELNRKSDEVNQRAGKIGDLTQKLMELANRVISPSDNPPTELAKNILRDYSPDPKNLLRTFASQPGDSSASMLKNLIGRGMQETLAGLKEDLGFAFWKAQISAETDSLKAYFGVVRQTQNSEENIVWLEISEQKIVNVICYEKVLVVSAPDTANWNKLANYVTYKTFLTSDLSGTASIPLVGPTWTLAQTFKASRAEPIRGTEKPLPISTLPDVSQTEGPILEIAAKDITSDFSLARSMLLKADNFNAAALVSSRVESKELRDVLIDLLTRSIKHETAVPNLTLGPGVKNEVFGRFAAAALKPSFSILDIPKPKSRNSGDSRVGNELEEYLVICQYSADLARTKYNRLTLVRDVTANQWILSAFDDPYVLPPSTVDSSTKYSNYDGFTEETTQVATPTSTATPKVSQTPTATSKVSVSPKTSVTPRANSPQPRKTPPNG